MSRCVVCNKVLRPEEIIWKPEIGEHEDHCAACLNRHTYEDYDTVVSWDENSPHE